MNVKFSCAPQVTNSQVIDRLNELERLIYNPFFKVKMNDVLSYVVSQTTHGLQAIRDVIVLKPSGEKVITAVRIYPDKTVKIDSNVSLLDSTLIIF